MIRARERERSDEGEKRIVAGGPEHSRIGNPQVLPREHIVRSQVSGGTAEGRGREAIEKVRGVKGWVAQVQRVCVSL